MISTRLSFTLISFTPSNQSLTIKTLIHQMETQSPSPPAIVATKKLAIITPRSSTPTHKPMTLKMSTNTSYKDSIDSLIDSHLKQFITIRQPFEVFKPMHHLVLTTPKNFAPALCSAACEAVGGRRSEALSAAAALHLMHVASCTHENLLTGNVNHKLKYSFGSNIELLTGDGILPLGLQLLATSGQNRNDSIDTQSIDESYASRVVRVITEITKAIGSRGVIYTQYKKYASDGTDHEDASPHVKQLRSKKGEFYGCSAACGAILGGGSEEKVENLRRCGIFVGMMNEESLDENGDGTVGEVENVIMELRDLAMMELRDLAMMELEGLDAGRIEFISSVVDSVFCDGKCRRVWSDREMSDVV